MKIIPVIDLKSGQVVQAIKGDRFNYKPVQSQLCSGCSPVDIVTALLEATHSDTLYIADLDSIENLDNNFQIILDLARQNENITFWLDAGFTSSDQLKPWQKIANIRPVIGSESHSKIDSLLSLLKSDHILSLDFRNDQLCGPDEILVHHENWPDDVIIMSLDTVGSNSGPDLKLINQIKTIRSNSRFYAAGGVRDQPDLDLLTQAGVEGVLIASALHTKSLSFNLK